MSTQSKLCLYFNIVITTLIKDYSVSTAKIGKKIRKQNTFRPVWLNCKWLILKEWDIFYSAMIMDLFYVPHVSNNSCAFISSPISRIISKAYTCFFFFFEIKPYANQTREFPPERWQNNLPNFRSKKFKNTLDI